MKSTFGIGIILCSIPIVFASSIDEIDNISALVSLTISRIMLVSGSFITFKDIVDIVNSIIKKVNCMNEIKKMKEKSNLIYDNKVKEKIKCKKIR